MRSITSGYGRVAPTVGGGILFQGALEARVLGEHCAREGATGGMRRVRHGDGRREHLRLVPLPWSWSRGTWSAAVEETVVVVGTVVLVMVITRKIALFIMIKCYDSSTL